MEGITQLRRCGSQARSREHRESRWIRLAIRERLAQAEPTREVEPEGPPLLERMAMISGVLEQSWYVLFSTLLGASPPRPEVVVTLLAVLELVRLQRARAQQRELFGEIVIERGSGEGTLGGA